MLAIFIIPCAYRGWGLKLTARLSLVPEIRMDTAVLPLSYMPYVTIINI